ncbi:MAG: cytochrome d ubiquinol oxidase subunit II [Muribaculaceae bacterium]|nr:cytochrome d ubiquinol oxidase subunit II [Muribaculaceae bacterium]
MTELQMFQAYWWLLIAVLGAVLVFMLFVQGGQSMLYCRMSNDERQMMVNSLGRKWELTFTTLVVFGGAFFASFPLFYSTSFGGAYWLWMSILISFVLQAVSYEYRRKRGNLYGTRTYDIFLLINGFFGCVLLGVAVGMMFFGGDFEISRASLLDAGSPVISRWAPTRGLEAIASWQCLLLGIAVYFLARTQAALYFINNIRHDDEFERHMRRKVLVNGLIFAVLFVAWVIVLFLADGKQATSDGTIVNVPNLYLHNYLEMWGWLVAFLLGVLLVLCGIAAGAFTRDRKGIWMSGIGTVLVVMSLFAVAGYNGTCYLPSNTHPQSSLTLANSSSSLYTLRTMSWVSLFIPVVILYIAYVWRKMNHGGITPKDIEDGAHQY